MAANPFGVTLKKSKGPTNLNTAPRSKGDELPVISRRRESLRRVEHPETKIKGGGSSNSTDGVSPATTTGSKQKRTQELINKRRTSLRKVNRVPSKDKSVLSRKAPPRRFSGKYSKPWESPFAVTRNPLMNVVLRPVKRHDDAKTDDKKKKNGPDDKPGLSNSPNSSDNDEDSDYDDDGKGVILDLEFAEGSTFDDMSVLTGDATTCTGVDVVRNKGGGDTDDHSSGSSSSTTEEGPAPQEAAALFGVRLKPTLRSTKKHKKQMGRTYQIDLRPNVKQGSATGTSYQANSRSFLEISLKPVSRRGGDGSSSNPTMDDTSMKDASARSDGSSSSLPEFVELQLRHIVAPEDGGPKRAVTTATMQIPMLRSVVPAEKPEKDMTPDERRRLKRAQRVKHEQEDKLKAFLQIAMSNLHPTDTSKEPREFNLMHFMLRHVDPNTNQFLTGGKPFGFDVKLKSIEETDRDHRRGGLQPPSMQVSLRHVEPSSSWRPTPYSETNPVLKEFFSELKVRSTRVSEEDEPTWDEYEVEGYYDEELIEEEELLEEEEIIDEELIDEEIIDEEIIEEEIIEEEILNKKKAAVDEYDEEEILNKKKVVVDEYDELEIIDKKKAVVDQYEEEEILDKKKAVADEYDEVEILDKKKRVGDEYDEVEIIDGKTQQSSSSPPAAEAEGDAGKARFLRRNSVNTYGILNQAQSYNDNENNDDAAKKKQVEEPKKETPVKPSAESQEKKEEANSRSRPSRRGPLQRQRSRSLSDMDRAARGGRKGDGYKAKEKPKAELTEKKQRDLLMWYNRMKCPYREDMKRRVAKLPDDCDITPEDVDALPWLCKGKFLDLRVMNQMFLNDWQGVASKKKASNDNDSD